jgi:hypothetical protein
MNKPDERKRGVPGRGQRRKRQRKRQDDTRKQEPQPNHQHQHHQSKKHQQPKHRTITATASNVNVADDIEEQLRLQRKKKQESVSENITTNRAAAAADANTTSAEKSKSEPSPPRKQLGRFRYDQERGAYFPVNHNHNDDIAIDKQKKKQEQEQAELLASPAFAASRATAKAPPASFAYPTSLCSSSAKRSRLVAQWGGKCLLESATFTASAVRSRSTSRTKASDQPWSCLFPSSSNSLSSRSTGRAASDLSCKSVMPPWTRTFDVAKSTSATSDQIPPHVPLLVTTLTEEGAMTRCTTANSNNNNINHNTSSNSSSNMCSISRIREPCVTTRFLQGHRGGMDVGFVLQKQDYAGGSDFVRKQVDGGASAGGRVSTGGSSNRRRRYNNAEAEAEYLTHIPAKVNDFVGIDNDEAVLFAAMMYGADRKVTPWSIDYRSSTMARAVSVDNFPQSEAVCVATVSAGSGGKGSLAYFGHRTGELTLWDARSSTCQSTLPRQSGGNSRYRSNEEIRTIVNVLPLTETPHYVLTRGLFDMCCLYDMRKLTSSTSSSDGRNNNKENDPSIVHNFTVPSYVSRRAEKKPSLCSGVATNPSQTFVIAPYTRATDTRYSTSATESCLGMWSLYTGEFVGSKDIATPSPPAAIAANENSNRRQDFSLAHDKRGPSVVELCPTITPAWTWKEPTPNAPRIEKVPGSFGLWFKSNCDLARDDNIPGEAGSIHHVVFDGRTD